MSNKKYKYLLFSTLLTSLFILFQACSGKVYDETMASYDDGTPKLVYTVKEGKNNQKIKLGEKYYYADGKIMYEKYFDDNEPDGIWKFYYPNGNIFAEVDYSDNKELGSNWKILTEKGTPFYEGEFDSMAVLEVTPDHRPLSISYYYGDEEMRYQFNDNFTINAKGKVKGGKKDGTWEFFYANGQIMLEAHYQDGRENGAYNSYRETGIPYFRGFYINGSRANVWEIYDEAGNLVDRKDYDKH